MPSRVKRVSLGQRGRVMNGLQVLKGRVITSHTLSVWWMRSVCVGGRTGTNRKSGAQRHNREEEEEEEEEAPPWFWLHSLVCLAVMSSPVLPVDGGTSSRRRSGSPWEKVMKIHWNIGEEKRLSPHLRGFFPF